jgi:CheY-like chemotaxis protein
MTHNLKILIVEDNNDRIKWFQKEFGNEELTIATNASVAIKYVRTVLYSVIMLDHDLSGRVYVDSHEPDTGFQVAKAIIVSINKDTPVIIHSWNPAGVVNIQGILPNSVYLPFGSFSRSVLK